MIAQANILLDNGGHTQLCDFGLTVIGEETQGRMTTSINVSGTLNWMSPERLFAEHHRRTMADDVYAFACLIYFVSTQPSACTVSLTRTYRCSPATLRFIR
jgi:serine/threonine protein kinase